MKALSIQQPWAWLIVHGYKDIENRDWSTYERGRFAVHAGKRFDLTGFERVRREHPEIPMPDASNFALGGIVGEATLIGCVSASRSPWFTGRYGFVLDNARPVPFVPLRGRLGFFPAPAGIPHAE